MKISRLLKVLEDLVALKFSDPKGKHGRLFYRNLHRILRAFLSQDGVPLKTKLQALTPSMVVYAKVRIHEQIVSEDVNNCVHFIVLEVARVLLETEYLKLKEKDPSKCLFVQTLQQTTRSLKSSPDGQLFEALANVLLTTWSHPVLLKMLQQEHNDSETIPYVAFIESVENTDIIRLRVRMLLETGCRELADNLISWCVASRMFDCDVYILLRRLDFLLKSDRAEEFHQLCHQISCCTARKLLDSARQGTIVRISRSTVLTMSRTFFLLDWIKATDLSCTRELLKHWMVLEYETLKRERRLAIAAFNKVIALAHSVRQIVLFVDVLESQFGTEFRTFCSELMEQAIRQERHRLDCARLYQRDTEDVLDATESLVAICRILGRIYKDHCQMNLSCRLCCLYLDPTVADFCCLEKEYANLESSPSTEPAPPPHVCAKAYGTLLSAIELLRPESFALSSLWTELKPILVAYMEDAGFCYSESKKRFKNHLKRVESGKCFGSRNRKTWKGMNNADAENGIETKSFGKKELAKIGNGFVKRSRVKTDLAKLGHIKKELKVGENSNKRKQNPDGECGVTSYGTTIDSASSEQPSKKVRALDSVLPPKPIVRSALDSSVDVRDVAGESGGENSTDSGAVSEHSSGLRMMSGSETRRQSLLARRYVWSSHSSASASPASSLNPQRFSSLDTMSKSDKETACQDSHDFSKNLELCSMSVAFSPCVSLCSRNSSNISSNPPRFSTGGKLDKNSNLHVESVTTSNITSFNSSVNGNPSSCSNAVKSNAEDQKVKGRSSLGAWASKFLAYCSSVSESEVEFEQRDENLTVASTDLAVGTTDLAVPTTDLAVVTGTSITSVSSPSSSIAVVSCMTVESGTNTSRSGSLESLTSPKVACISENHSSCSSKSSECRLRSSSTLGLVAEGAEPSLSTVTEIHDVKPNPTSVEDFGLNGSAPVMTDTCQSSVEAVTPALDDVVSGSSSESHIPCVFVSACGVELTAPSVIDSGSKGASSDIDCGSTVMLSMTSEVESCRKSAHSTSNAETTIELSTTSDITCDITETSVLESLCTRKITSNSIQGGIFQSSVAVSSSTLKLETVATDSLSFEKPLAAGVSAVGPSLACTNEMLMPPPISTLTETLTDTAVSGEPEVETAVSVCQRNEEAVMTSTSETFDSHSDSSSSSAHPSFTSLPIETTSVIMATSSNESLTSRVVYSCVPVMSVTEEMWSASMEPQAAVLGDSTTYAVYELELESVMPISTTDTMISINQTAAATPDSAAGFQHTADEISEMVSSPHDVIASSNEMYLDTPEEAYSGVSESNTSLGLSQDVMEMLETVGQTVTCNKKKRHSADFVQRLWKILKPDSETSSSSHSPASLRGSEFAETSTELNVAKRNEGPEDIQNGDTTAMDLGVTKELFQSPKSLGSVETSGNNVLNDPQIDPLHDHVSKTACDVYEKAYSTKASVSTKTLAVAFQDNCVEINDSHQKLSSAANSHNIQTDQTVGIGTDSTPNFHADVAQTDQAVDGQLVDMSIFNMPENRQHLLLYNSLREEHERNQDSRRMLAAIRFDNTMVPVLPTNLFYYERACPKLRDMLTNSSTCNSDALTNEGVTLRGRKNVLNSGQSLRKDKSAASLLTLLNGGCASDGFVKGGESLDDRQDIHTEPASDEEKRRSEVRGLLQDNSGKGQELSGNSCCMEGQGHVGDVFNKSQHVSMEPVAGGGNQIESQCTGGEKLSKGKRPSVENSSKAQGTGGRNSGKGRSSIEENSSKICSASSGDRFVCILCGKALSSDFGFRLHIIRLHDMDFVNGQAPEEGYRCRLCDQRWKLLSLCTCRRKSTSGKTIHSAVSSEKPSEDSSEHLSSCHKKEGKCSNDRKASLDGNSGCDMSTRGKSNSKSNDRSRRGKSNSQSKEKKKSSSRNIVVASQSKVSNRDNNGGAEGTTDRQCRKRLFCGAKKNTDNSSVSSDHKHRARENSSGAEGSICRRSRKRLFGEGNRESMDDSFPSDRRKSNAGEDCGRVNPPRVSRPGLKGAKNSSQKHWRLRDRVTVKTV